MINVIIVQCNCSMISHLMNLQKLNGNDYLIIYIDYLFEIEILYNLKRSFFYSYFWDFDGCLLSPNLWQLYPYGESFIGSSDENFMVCFSSK